MKGFIVFEVAAPIRWNPSYGRSGYVRRITWLWFAFSLVTGLKMSEYCSPIPNTKLKDDDIDYDNKDIWFI